MFIDIIYPLLWFLLIFFGLRYQKIFQLDGLSKWDLSIGFLIKSLANLFFTYLFTYYYGQGVLEFDSYMFFVDSKVLNNIFYENPVDYLKMLTGIGETFQMAQEYMKHTEKWFFSYTYFIDDSKNVVRLSSLIHFISFNSFTFHGIIFNFLSLLGVFFMYKGLNVISKLKPEYIFYGLVCLPSLTFWSSSISKEAPLIFGLGLLFYTLVNFNFKKLLSWFRLLLSLFVLIAFKPYILFGVAFILVIYFSKSIFKGKAFIQLTFIFLAPISVFVLFKDVRQDFTNKISFKQHDFINVGKGGLFCIDSLSGNEYNIKNEDFNKIELKNDRVKILAKVELIEIDRRSKVNRHFWVDSTNKMDLNFQAEFMKSESYVETTPIRTSFKQLILNIPQALINSLFRPFPTDPGKEFKYFAFIETLILFAFFFFSLLRRRRLNNDTKVFVIALAVFVILIALLIGWTTPILGAIVRYRIPVYLAILLISFIIIEPPKRWKKGNIF